MTTNNEQDPLKKAQARYEATEKGKERHRRYQRKRYAEDPEYREKKKKEDSDRSKSDWKKEYNREYYRKKKAEKQAQQDAQEN